MKQSRFIYWEPIRTATVGKATVKLEESSDGRYSVTISRNDIRQGRVFVNNDFDHYYMEAKLFFEKRLTDGESYLNRYGVGLGEIS